MAGNPRANAALVEALGSALREGEHGLKTGPALLLRILREESWRSFVTQRGDQVEYDSFERFVTTPPLKGLGASMRLIKKLVDSAEEDAERSEALNLLDMAIGKRQGQRTDFVHNINEVASEGRPYGTSRAAGLRRLRKDRPDLHAEVLAGRLTTHAAMIKAGFRHRTVNIPVDKPDAAAQALRRNLTPEAYQELARIMAADT